MAALLRQGARRVGGSVLQRTQAAATSPAGAEERRRLVPRRMYTTEEREQVLREIQQKKEELYDAIAKGDNRFRVRSWNNTLLQQILCTQISPRPWSFDWRHDRYARRANSVAGFGFMALGALAIYDMRERILAEREAAGADVMVEGHAADVV